MASFLGGLGAFGGGFGKALQAGSQNYMRQKLFDQQQGALDTAGSALFADPQLNQMARDPRAPGALGGLQGRSSGIMDLQDEYAGMDPAFRDKLMLMQADLQDRGIDTRVLSGYRDPAKQDELYAQGRGAPGPIVTNAPGGSSYHNYGAAADLSPYDPSQKQSMFQNMGQLAPQNGLGWGGNFKSLYDPGHVQQNVPLSQLRAQGMPPTPGGAPQPQGGPPQPQGQMQPQQGAPQQGQQQGGFSPMLQRAIGMINQANPKASPMQKMLALEKMAPLLDMDSKQQLAQMRMEFQGQQLDLRAQIAQETDARQREFDQSKNDRADKHEAGLTDRAAKKLEFDQSKEGRLAATAQDKLDLALRTADRADSREVRLAEASRDRLKMLQDKAQTAKEAAINAKTNAELKIRLATAAEARRAVEGEQRNFVGLANAAANLGRSSLPNKQLQPILQDVEKQRGGARARLGASQGGIPTKPQNEDAAQQPQVPASVVEVLKKAPPGQGVKFPNGEVWTLENGQPKKVQ